MPVFAICPPPRCYARVGSAPARFCGELAAWKRCGAWWFDDAYFCDVHRGETDVAIAGDLVIRRVRIACDVLLAGVSMRAPVCQGEALARLEAAVGALGGILDVSRVLSTVGRYSGQPGAGGATDSAGDPL